MELSSLKSFQQGLQEDVMQPAHQVGGLERELHTPFTESQNCAIFHSGHIATVSIFCDIFFVGTLKGSIVIEYFQSVHFIYILSWKTIFKLLCHIF